MSCSHGQKTTSEMTIEEKTFQYLRFVPEKMTAYGFTTQDGGYDHQTEFMDGAFRAEILVTDAGTVSSTVIDMMNGEEYAPLRNERFDGAYVNAVRNAYEELLKEIAAACCTDVLFASEQANRIARAIYDSYHVSPDFPWKGDRSGVFRHTDTRKWFGLIMRIRRKSLLKNSDETPVDVINLKIDPKDERTAQEGIYPAFHMNHKQWISVVLDDTLTDAQVMQYIARSFHMTAKNR